MEDLIRWYSDLTTRLANKEWASRPREQRAKFASLLTLELAIVCGLSGFVIAVVGGNAAIGIAAGTAVFVCFLVFFALLVISPQAAFRWVLLVPIVLALAALIGAFIAAQ